MKSMKSITLFILFLLVILTQLFNGKKSSRKRKQNIVKPTNDQFGNLSRTLKGHNVRSNGEALIANFLYEQGINYVYEPRLLGMKPDFYIPNRKLIIEYFGLYFVPGSIGEKYRKDASYKTRIYKQANYNFLALFPKDLDHLDSIFTKLSILYKINVSPKDK